MVGLFSEVTIIEIAHSIHVNQDLLYMNMNIYIRVHFPRIPRKLHGK